MAVLGLATLAAAFLLHRSATEPRGAGENGNAQSAPGQGTPSGAGALDATARDLLDRLHQGDRRAYHAVYAVTGDPAAIGGTLTIEVWHAPPRTRQDTTLVTGETTLRTETLSDGASGQLCTATGSAGWHCAPSAAAAARTGGVAGAVVAAVGGHAVTASAQRVDDRQLRCFTIEVAQRPRVCLDGDGVVALLSDAEVTYRVTTLDTEVAGSVFAAPTG